MLYSNRPLNMTSILYYTIFYIFYFLNYNDKTILRTGVNLPFNFESTFKFSFTLRIIPADMQRILTTTFSFLLGTFFLEDPCATTSDNSMSSFKDYQYTKVSCFDL